jgi:peptidoglycan/xylan/chitin deacetylase (PgdA/CDA1 family)
MYHRVCAQGPAALARYRVTPEVFRAQVAHLRAAGFTGITAKELAGALAGGAPLPARPVLFTFDDGYLDFAAEAWPVLKAAGFPATLFVVPGKVGRTADWDGGDGAATPLLDWDQLARLADEGVEIENHGFDHRRMASLPPPQIYREVLDSAAAIAQVLGCPPTSFCYPFGSRDAVVERVVEECGHRLGFTTSHGLCPLTASPLRLPRLEVSGYDDLEAFARKLDA